LQSKPLDGQQVEPALAEPEPVQGLKETDKANGSWRANSPSWPGINKSMQQLEAGYT